VTQLDLTAFLKGAEEARVEARAEPRKGAEASDGGGWVEETLLYAWAAPIIVDPRWPELDEEFKLRVRVARALEGPRCVEERLATDMDALAYLHTACLSQPFNQTWYRIYNYLFTKLFPELAEAVLGAEAVRELSDYERWELDGLKRWLYRKAMEAVKSERRAGRSEEGW